MERLLKDKIYKIAVNKALELGLEVVNLVFAGYGKKYLLKITIDKPSGVTIEDCEKMSRAVEALIDVQNLIHTSYTIEVTSPGLDRPLKTAKDFRRHIGSLVRIVTKEALNSKNCFIGRITDLGDNWVRLKEQNQKSQKGVRKKASDDGHDIIIPFEKISKARLEIEI